MENNHFPYQKIMSKFGRDWLGGQHWPVSLIFWSKKSSPAMLSDEQMTTGWPFSLVNDEQMSNQVRVEHQSGLAPTIFIHGVMGLLTVAENEWVSLVLLHPGISGVLFTLPLAGFWAHFSYP